MRDGVSETLSYYHFPREHEHQLRTNNLLERIMREIRRRSRVVGCFPDGNSALMLAAARLRYILGSRWGSRRYLNMQRLREKETARAVPSDKKFACPSVQVAENPQLAKTRGKAQTKKRKIPCTTLMNHSGG